MNSIYRHSTGDITLIVGLAIILIIGVIHMVINHKKHNSFKGYTIMTIIGVSLLILSTMGKCLDVGRWDREFMLSFLSLIRIEAGTLDQYGILFRFLAAFAISLIVAGLVGLGLTLLNRIKKNKS